MQPCQVHQAQRVVSPSNSAEEKEYVIEGPETSCSKRQRTKKTVSSEKCNLQARYWSYLFDNFHRAVEGLYTTCEVDESVVECQEVLMSLEMCCKDFVALIQRIELQKQFEKGKRPQSVAWEVRKITSPSKLLATHHPLAQSGAKRCLTFKPSGQENEAVSFLTHSCTDALMLVQTGMSATSSQSCADVRPSSQSCADVRPSSQSCADVRPSSQSCADVRPSSQTCADVRPSSQTCADVRPSRSLDTPSAMPEVSPETIVPGPGTKKELSASEAPTLTWADRVRSSLQHPLHSSASHVRRESCGTAKKRMESCDIAKKRMESCDIAKKRMESCDIAKKSNQYSVTSFILTESKYVLPLDTPSEYSRGKDGWTVARRRSGRHSKKAGNGYADCCSDTEQLCHVSSTPDIVLFKEKDGLASHGASTADTMSFQPMEDKNVTRDVAAISVEIKGPGKEDANYALHPPSTSCNDHMSTNQDELEPSTDQLLDWNTFTALCEANKNPIPWADRCESPPLTEVPRSPGRAIQLHQKFSSPNRKRPIEESIRIIEERQVRAQLQRGRLQEEKTHKLKLQTKKVKEVKEYRDALYRQRKEEMDEKMQRAEHLRESLLQEKVKKAQDEEIKVCEIAFINTLEAQNRRIKVLQRQEDYEARLLHRQREKQKRLQEQQAKEEAAQERLRLLMAECQAKRIEMEQRRKDQDVKREQARSEREKAREEALREKARKREQKLEARNVALQLSTEELERRIQHKQDESSRRHDMQLEQIKERASNTRHLSCDDAPRVELYKIQKWCTLCRVKIVSEIYLFSHLRSKRHQGVASQLSPEQSDPSNVIVEVPEEEQGLTKLQIQISERLCAGKKHARKLKQTMARAKEQEVEPIQSKSRPRLQKAIMEMNTLLSSIEQQPTVGSSVFGHLEQMVGSIERALSLKDLEDHLCFCQLGGIACLVRVLMLYTRQNIAAKQIEKASIIAAGILQSLCHKHMDICVHFVLTNNFAPVVELVLQLLVVLETKTQPTPGVDSCPQGAPSCSQGAPSCPQGAPSCPQGAPSAEKQLCLFRSANLSLCSLLMSLLGTIFSKLSCDAKHKSCENHILDCISLFVSVGVVDRLSDCFAAILVPIIMAELEQFVISGTNLLIALSGYLHRKVEHVFGHGFDDGTQFLVALRQTDLAGLLALLYAILLHDGPPRHSSVPPLLTVHTLSLVTAAFKAINNFAILDVTMVQECLGAEGISLEFRHVVGYLLWYCSHYKNSPLLQELILSIGYCCALNPDNQVFLHSGRSPTVLQLLCDLPFDYFTKPEFVRLLYPTLIAACYNSKENTAILSQEVSCRLLLTFLQENMLLFKEENKGIPDFYSFPYRFPKSHWELAMDYLSNSI